MSEIASSSSDSRSAVDVLHEAWDSGRPVVPFLAAGVSACSGFPLVSQLNDYLLKVKFYIRYGVYRYTLGRPRDTVLEIDDPEHRPSRYLLDYGWPNINQLNAELYHFCNWRQRDVDSRASNHRPQGTHDPVEDERRWIDEISSRTYQQDASRRLLKSYWDATQVNDQWGRKKWRHQTACQHVLLEDLRFQDRDLAEHIQNPVWKFEVVPRADWAQLLLDLTEGNLGLIDALLAQLALRYSPGSSHILLTHLVRKLGIRLLLTLNFDPYVEQALRQEGLQPRVLDIARDTVPPDPSVVRQTLSVVKLHGSAFSLRLGERLDYELDETTRNCVQRYVPDNALLLVLGFSGYERRMMQLITALTLRHAEAASEAIRAPRILWMHQEPEELLSPTVLELKSRLREMNKGRLFQNRRLATAEEFLFDVYQQLTSTLPKSTVPFSALPKRVTLTETSKNLAPRHEPPVKSGKQVGTDPDGEFSESKNIDGVEPGHTRGDGGARSDSLPSDSAKFGSAARPEQSFRLFYRESLAVRNPEGAAADASLPHWIVFERDPQDPTGPSIAMSRFVQRQWGYNVVWIDLEDHHTTAGVITEVIDKLRVFDPDLPPLVLPTDKTDHKAIGTGSYTNSATKAVGFIARAIKRARCLLAFDSLESFGRETNSHHGVPVMDTNQTLTRRIEELQTFLKQLTACTPLEKSITHTDRTADLIDIDWMCCISCDEPTPRHLPQASDEPQRSAWIQIRQSLSDFVDGWLKEAKPSETEESKRFSVYGSEALPCGKGSFKLSSQSPVATLLESLEKLQQVQADGKIDETAVESCETDLHLGITKSLERALMQFGGAHQGISLDRSNWEWLSESQDLSTAFMTLAIFRRPRSHVAIDTLWSEFLPPRWRMSMHEKHGLVEKAVNALCTTPLLKRMEGGHYWIPHRLHEWVYKFLSEPLRLRRLRGLEDSDLDRLSSAAPKALAPLVARAVFLTLVHSRVARFYYFHVFMRTHDVRALFEYFYHRVSAGRYAKQLHLYVNLASPEMFSVNAPATASIENLVCILLDYEGLRIAPHRADGKEKRDQLVESLLALRMKFARALYNVVVREDETISSTVSAESWLTWAQQMRADLDQIVADDSRIFGVKPSSTVIAQLWADDDPQLVELKFKLKWYLQDLEAHLLREKREWDECAQARLEILRQLCAAATEGSNAGTAIAGGSETIQRSRSALYDEVGKLCDEQLKRGTDSLQIIAKKFGPEGFQCVEVMVHSLLDLAACVRRGGRAETGRSKGIQKSVNKFHATAHSLLECWERLHSRDLHKTRSLARDIAVDETWQKFEKYDIWRIEQLDSVGYPHRRSIAKSVERRLRATEKVRHELRGGDFESLDELARRSCQLRLPEARGLLLLGKYEGARNALDNAVNGLDERKAEHRFLLAQVHRMRAETAMQSANQDVQRKWKDGKPLLDLAEHDAVRQVAAAATKLAEAEVELDEVERLLKGGRRDVEQWRQYYRERAQLQVEQLLLWLSGLEWKVHVPSELLKCVAEVHGFLLRGLEAIRGGGDCSLSPYESVDRDDVSKDRRLWIELWLQLMATGYLVLHRLYVRRIQEVRDHSWSADLTPMQRQVDAFLHQQKLNNDLGAEFISIESYCNRWKALNYSAGLTRFVHKRAEDCWKRVVNKVFSLAEKSEPIAAKDLGLHDKGVTRPWSREIAIEFAEKELAPPKSHEPRKHLVDELFHILFPDVTKTPT